jgi:antitoxin CptB
MMNADETADMDIRRKKLIFRAWHRGTREMDIIIGRFAEAHVPDFNAEQLGQLEELMKENDPDVYDWIIGRTEVPEHCRNGVIAALSAFYKMT